MCVTTWKLFQFPTEAMGEEYRKMMEVYALQFTNLWCLIQFIDGLVDLIWQAVYFDWFHQFTWDCAVHLIPTLIPSVLFIVTNWIPSVRRRASVLLCAACLAMVGWTLWSVHYLTSTHVHLTQTMAMPHVWALVQPNPQAMEELQHYVAREATAKFLWNALNSVFLMFAILQLLGLSLPTATVFVSLPISVALASRLSSAIVVENPHVLTSACHAVLYMLCASYLIRRIQQQRVQSEYLLQQTLQNEALAMEKLARQETANKEQALQADTILNHMLKNIMADAASCIHLFTKSADMPPDLALAISCLERGMAWCKKRHTMLQISHGNYVPVLSPVNLQEFGEALVLGRTMSCHFVNDVVALDRTLCSIIVENAIANAFAHGNPNSPDVQFTMELKPNSSILHLMQLIIRVSNRVHPDRPKVTSKFVSRILSGDHEQTSPRATSLSDHLGLRHLFMAAEAHDMQLSLVQEGDIVVMQAVVQVEKHNTFHIDGTQAQGTPEVQPLDLSEFPPGLVVMCLEDSAVARCLLYQVLRCELADAKVHSFGENAMEVDTFVHEALAFADIVILDNHLEYGSAHFLGTDILQSLIAKGYRGFACIRSANSSEEDQAFYFECGAHLSIGKDLHPQDMMKRLKSAYLRFRQRDLIECAAQASLRCL